MIVNSPFARAFPVDTDYMLLLVTDLRRRIVIKFVQFEFKLIGTNPNLLLSANDRHYILLMQISATDFGDVGLHFVQILSV